MYSYREVDPCRDDIKALVRVLGPHSKYEHSYDYEDYEWRNPPEREYESIAAMNIFDERGIAEIHLRLKAPLTERQAIQKFGRPSAKEKHKGTLYFNYYPGGRKPEGEEAYMSLPFEEGRAVQINILC